jgi:DNA-binding protein Fis
MQHQYTEHKLEETHDMLMEAYVKMLANGMDPNELPTKWARVEDMLVEIITYLTEERAKAQDMLVVKDRTNIRDMLKSKARSSFDDDEVSIVDQLRAKTTTKH